MGGILHKVILSKTFLGFLILLLGLNACSPQSEPIHYGFDVCAHCKMMIVDNKFGAELVSTKGKVYKFDDIKCLINFYNTSDENYLYNLVTDYTTQGKWIDAMNAFYIYSEMIHSPMNGQVVAFETYPAMKNFRKQSKGIYLTWGELITKYK